MRVDTTLSYLQNPACAHQKLYVKSITCSFRCPSGQHTWAFIYPYLHQ